ncbi:MAG: hypothetical protein ABF893_18685, partial [Gluconacetobacter liquefaciens]
TAVAPPPPARKPPPPRHHRERELEDAAVQANGNPVTGFGTEVPAFMLLPRRQFTITPSADEESTHTADEPA